MNVGRQAAEAASRLLLVPSVPSSPGPVSRPQIQVYQDFPGLQISIDLYRSMAIAFFDGKYGDHPIWVCLKIEKTPKVNGFADHYPYFLWLFHWEYTQHFQTNPYHPMTFMVIFGRCTARMEIGGSGNWTRKKRLVLFLDLKPFWGDTSSDTFTYIKYIHVCVCIHILSFWMQSATSWLKDPCQEDHHAALE